MTFKKHLEFVSTTGSGSDPDATVVGDGILRSDAIVDASGHSSKSNPQKVGRGGVAGLALLGS